MRRLLTWLDVQLVIDEHRFAKQWPDWLLTASAYHDGLVVGAKDAAASSDIEALLREWFGERYDPRQGLIFEGVPNRPSVFPVTIDKLAGSNSSTEERVEPMFRDLAVRSSAQSPDSLPKQLPNGSPPVIVFYSYKGGVGRTTHLLAYLLAVSSRSNPLRALVIDADLEAPGITALAQAEKQFSFSFLSFVDFLALSHGDGSEGFSDSLEFSSYSLKRQVIQVSGIEHYFMPAFRDEIQALRLDIRPEHLISVPGNQWILAELIATLGLKLNVNVVLVDLRAGFSELAGPLLFDPRIDRVIVTTPSFQSFEGTITVIQQLAKLGSISLREDFSDPSLFFSFVTPELSKSAELQRLIDRVWSSYPTREDDLFGTARVRIGQTAFAQELLYLASLSDAFERLRGTSLAKAMAEFSDELEPVISVAQPILTLEQSNVMRNSLSTIAKTLEYAESGEGQSFLRVAPLRALATVFQSSVPICVIVGSKGSGKTYTALQVARSETWSQFVGLISHSQTAEKWGSIWPLLHSKNLQESARRIIDAARQQSVSGLGLSGSFKTAFDTTDALRESLKHENADDTWWRHRWFTIIATSLGLPVASENESVGRVISYLRQRAERLVVVIDGLEDLFPDLDKHSGQQRAIRVLLQDVPAYLREVPDSPLGILVFIRRDLVRLAITQNVGQFETLYDAFALRWNDEEALRLAVWLAREAGTTLALTTNQPIELVTSEDAKKALVPVWGRKLGPDHSREARSAEWVIAALSDFNGQIQARDLVRFFRYAAEKSRGTAVTDRVLAARAVRDAIQPCSDEKIEEIKQEIPRLRQIFAHLQESTDRRIPFDAANSGLSADDIRFLESTGVIIEDRGEYFMPEIFRLGLRFQLAQGARPRVLSLARRVVG